MISRSNLNSFQKLMILKILKIDVQFVAFWSLCLKLSECKVKRAIEAKIKLFKTHACWSNDFFHFFYHLRHIFCVLCSCTHIIYVRIFNKNFSLNTPPRQWPLVSYFLLQFHLSIVTIDIYHVHMSNSLL